GSMMQNWLFVPMSGKLTYQNNMEAKSKEMVIEGVLSIQAGDNPRILAQKMLTYLTPKDRKTIESDVLKD
ncbi:MAG TPA: motility protein A, partial [Treponemataceae bacterium]|nr:motility protein A [Treponemataceae bacterium]